MANTDRENIVTNLSTVLSAINGSAPYSVAVAAVEIEDKVESEIHAEKTPWIGIVEQDSDYRDEPSRDYYVVFPIILKLVVASSSWLAARELVCDLYDDVFHAIHLDPSRGGAAHYTKVTRDGAPRKIAGEDHRATMSLNIECRYLRSITVNA